MVYQLSEPTKSEVIYPDCDGQPMANNTVQFRWIVVIKQNLDQLFANEQVFVAGDLFWYPIEGVNSVVTAPDVMVVCGRPKGDRKSYKQWEEGGIAPQVVFEILSPSNTKTEMEEKLLFYDRYGVEEYYIYDPATKQLQGWLRGEYGLSAIEAIADWVSPRLGIRFDCSGEELEIYRPDGDRFSSYHEIFERLEQTEQQLQEERRRSEELAEMLRQYQEQFGDLPNS